MAPEKESLKALHVRAYAAAGFALIPTCSPTIPHVHRGADKKDHPCKTPGKVPSSNGWAKTRPGRFTEGDLAGNYGVVLTDTDLVVDVDPRNYAAGVDSLAALRAAIPLPETYTVRTGGDGLHFYMKKPAGVRVSNELPEYPGIEFKSTGRQVIGPGSIHGGTGKPYEVVQGTPKGTAKAPEALLLLIARPDADLGAGTGRYVDDIASRERFSSYLAGTAEPSVMGRGGDANAFRVACRGRDLALPPAVTYELMLQDWNPRCEPPWDADELKGKVAHAYRYARGEVGAGHPAADFAVVAPPVDEAVEGVMPAAPKDEDLTWETTPQGGTKRSFLNLLNLMRVSNGGLFRVFGYNQFTGQVEFRVPAPWHGGRMPGHPIIGDDDLKMLKAFLATRHKFEASVASIEEAVTVVAKDHSHHPVREYLAGLTWDGKARLETWMIDYCGAEDTAYTRAVSRKVPCAAVTRVLRPGVKFDHVLVLEGAQDLGKSGVCEILGGPYYADFPIDTHAPDTVQMLQEAWVVELAELEVSRRTETDAMKAFLSRRKDTARFSYGRRAGQFPRHFIFVATKNPGVDGTYLKDDTGNRRWWPIRVRGLERCAGQVDFKGLKDARDQIFAEAVARVKANAEPLFMETRELKEAAKAEAASRHAEHPWVQRVTEWVAAQEPRPVFLTTRQVFCDALGGLDKQLDRKVQVGVAAVFRAMEWAPGHRRVDGRIVRGYEPTDPLAGLG